jgi:hypothetical protein
MIEKEKEALQRCENLKSQIAILDKERKKKGKVMKVFIIAFLT